MSKNKISWNKAESYFVTSEIKPTYAEVAEKFKVSRPSVTRHAGLDDWVEKRGRFEAETLERVREELLATVVEANLDSLGVMEGQLRALTDVQRRLLEEFAGRSLSPGSLSDKELLDAVTRIAKAQENGVRAISFLKGGADSRKELTFAELATMKREKK